MTTEDKEENKDLNKSSKPKKAKSKKTTKSEIKELKSAIEKLENQLSEAKENESKEKENALRHMAELENFRRRKQQEVDTFKKYASEQVIVEFLTILDHFKMASEHAEKEGQDTSDVIKGFLLINKQLESTLEKLNVTEIKALDEPFDPNLHQAVGQDSADGVKADIVIKEMQKGYKLADRVIRPSMVIVSA